MSKARAMIIALVAVCASSAIGSTTASAAEWFVNGTPLTTTAGLSTTTKVETGGLVFTVPALPLTVQCSSLGGVKPELVAASRGRASELVFGGCRVGSGPSGCELEESEVATEPVEALVSLASKAPEDVVSVSAQKSKNVLAAVPFNTHCGPLSGTQPADGRFFSTLPAGQTASTTQAVKGLSTKSPAGLTIGGSATYQSGGFTGSLFFQFTWNFR